MKKRLAYQPKLLPCNSVFLVCFILLVAGIANGQPFNSDSAWKHTYKNIIRYNFSGALLIGANKYVVLGYERLLKPNQSISINGGVVALPNIFYRAADSFTLKETNKNNGYNFSADYRFYLKKENKNQAPRGVYAGPFYSYNQFRKENDWSFKDGTPFQRMVASDLTFNVHTIGVELGYQFVFWKRLAVDFVMVGPGVSNYYLKAKVDGNISEENKEILKDKLQQFLNNTFPGLAYAIEEQELSSQGTVRTWALGYRFLIHIGFSF